MACSRYEDVSLLSFESEAISAYTASAKVCASAKKRPWIVQSESGVEEASPALSMLDIRRRCEPYFDSLTKSEMLYSESLI